MMDSENKSPEVAEILLSEAQVLAEPEMRKLAHLPLLTVFYLGLQRQISSTPVTALELAAYLGLEVRVVEGLLAFLQKRGWVCSFSQELPAYSLTRDFDQLTVKDLLEMVAEIQRQLKNAGVRAQGLEARSDDERYRKLYSDLASEILQLFGRDAVNQMPV